MNLEEFKKALSELNIELTVQQETQLHRYYELLVEWNEKMNLTGITEEDQVYLKHFYDSATLVKAIDLTKVSTLCDIGTGAGFPGLVLKILFPHLSITLVDSLNKRIRFLNEVIKELKLSDITTEHARAEEFAVNHRESFDIVTARAVAPLSILTEYCLPMVKLKQYFIPMKANIAQEIKSGGKAMKLLGGEIEELFEFLLPKEGSQRSLLKVKKVKETSRKYPRKYPEMKKRPL